MKTKLANYLNKETDLQKLETAKKNVKWLLENANGLVDMHGLSYWAGVVESKREEIKKGL